MEPGGGPPPPPPPPPGVSPVVHRTQVLLLSGEPGAPHSGQAVVGSFAHRVLTPGAACPTAASFSPCPSSSPSAQLVFFVVRWGSLRERPGPVKEALRGLQAQVGGSPATALVGVVVQPPPAHEEEALHLLEGALQEVFFQDGPAPEVHAALFAPGGPHSALRLRRLDPQQGASASPRTTPSAFWKDKTVMMQILGAVVSLGTMAYSSYYFYNNPPL